MFDLSTREFWTVVHGLVLGTVFLLLFGGEPRIKNAKGHDAIALARAAGHEWLAERLEAQS